MRRALIAPTLLALAANLPAAETEIPPAPEMTGSHELTLLGRHHTGQFDESAAEIVAFDANTKRAFVINALTASVDVLDISDPTNPTKVGNLPTDPDGSGMEANSVAVSNGIVAVAVEAAETQAAGHVAFFNAADFHPITTVPAGALPDMVAWSADGRYVVVANEGEPNDSYTVDPEGSITVIDVSGGLASASARTADFSAFNGQLDELRAAGVRIFGPGASVAQDLEPEYVAISPDSTMAYVVCQENNALAVVDLAAASVTAVVPLGFKPGWDPANAFDASNKDDAINIRTWPVWMMYQPDAIVAFEHNGATMLITANEGDAREYEDEPGYVEETRAGKVTLDPVAFPNAEWLQQKANMGRLKITTERGDVDGDGDFDALYAYGARSVTIWNAADGSIVWDSANQFERITAHALGEHFNASNDEHDGDDRSDDKGPEPEALAVAEIDGKRLLFVGLERVGGVVVYDITDPAAPQVVTYRNDRNFNAEPNTPEAGDLGPEGLAVVAAEHSPTGRPLLIVGNEVSGTTTIYQIDAGN